MMKIKRLLALMKQCIYMQMKNSTVRRKITDFGKRGQTINCWQTDALSTNTENLIKSSFLHE